MHSFGDSIACKRLRLLAKKNSLEPMPQLEGQPGSRGMNPPGGISTINLYNWSEPSQPSAPPRRNNQSNDENLSQGANENTASGLSAGASPWTENNRGITRMHQVCIERDRILEILLNVLTKWVYSEEYGAIPSCITPRYFQIHFGG